MYAKAIAYLTGLSPTTYAFVGVFVAGLFFGGCAGCACDRVRPHWIIKVPIESSEK